MITWFLGEQFEVKEQIDFKKGDISHKNTDKVDSY